MKWNPFEDRKSSVLVVLALVSLGFVVGAEWWRWRSDADPRHGQLTPGTRVPGADGAPDE
ncbi:MAG: hypothetical protein HY553_03385, partial [Elusimicrobia bacterium]|nr:hypothetical protein [Elusimicrobiota bacterium]